MRLFSMACILAFSACADIGSQRQLTLQRKQADADALFRVVFENAPIPMAITRLADGKLVRANNNLVEASGLVNDSMADQTARESGIRSRNRASDAVFERADRGIPSSGELVVLKNLAGELRTFVLWTQTLMLSGDSHIVWMGSDITELEESRRQLEEQRNHLKELLAERTHEIELAQDRLRITEHLASIGTLAAGVAHEINNPVGSILNAAQYALLCRNDEDADTIATESFEKIVELATRCGGIVKGIVQFSRNEPSEKWVSNVNDAVRLAIDLAQPGADQVGIKLEANLASDPLAAMMNPVEVEQALINLIHNAIDSQPVGGGVVLVSTESLSDGVRIIVRDAGCGMDKHGLRCAFEPFHTTRQHLGGMGLGLSIVHGIVNSHGGKIEIESEPGVGTTVTMDLPGA